MAMITFITGGEEILIEAEPGKTIAQIAEERGIRLFGSCKGSSMCCQCSRRIKAGIETLLRRGGGPYIIPENAAPFVRTCQAVPGSDVTVECESQARF